MIEITNLTTSGWEAAIRGMRNPMNSWAKSDSLFCIGAFEDTYEITEVNEIGSNDLNLATRLIKAGPEHAKFLRMIHVQMDIKAPLYWHKEMDTYKVGTTANSCSTMHKIAAKEFTFDDFSCEHLFGAPTNKDATTATLGVTPNKVLSDLIGVPEKVIEEYGVSTFLPFGTLSEIIDQLNAYRKLYIKTKDKKYWWQMIQLLPSSYNQLRTWDASLQTVLSILHQRKGHKLDEWHTFRHVCFEQIPYCKEFYTAMTGDKDYEIC